MITQTFSKNVLNWIDWQEQKLCNRRQQRLLKQAIHRAFQKFARRHPRWAISLFDEHFLAGALTPLLVGDGQPPRLPTTDELVAAWAAQFISVAPAADNLRHSQIWLVAADFLTYLEMEWQS